MKKINKFLNSGIIPFILEPKTFPEAEWTVTHRKKQQEEEKAYEENMSQPYYKLHDKPTFEQWKLLNQIRQQNQGVIKLAENVSAPVNAVNQYVRLFKYDMANGKIPKGKYTIPAAVLASAGIVGFAAAPVSFIAGGVGAEVGGKTFDFGTKLVTGKSWADNVRDRTGLDTEAAVMTNPGMWVGGFAPFKNQISKGFQYVSKATPEVIRLMPYSNTMVKNALSNNNWYSRALRDVTSDPIGTFKDVIHGRYAYNYKSLRRMVENVKKDVEAGRDFTSSEYKALTGLDIPDTPIRIQSWKHFEPGSRAFYDIENKTINFPAYASRNTNRGAKSIENKVVGAHEQTHAAEDFRRSLMKHHIINGMSEWDSENLLTMLSPELSKSLNFRYYYLPNINNPVSNKYYDLFVDNALRIGFYHAASPEEHWANYMGAKSIGRNYDKWNKSLERIKAPEGFIDDFKNYLKNYYNKK